MDADILNIALKMRLSDNFSVNERLQALYPQLSEDEADLYRRECGTVIRHGYEIAESIRLKTLPRGKTGTALLRERFSWLQKENATQVLSYQDYSVWRNYGFDWDKTFVWSLWCIAFLFSWFCLAWWL